MGLSHPKTISKIANFLCKSINILVNPGPKVKVSCNKIHGVTLFNEFSYTVKVNLSLLKYQKRQSKSLIQAQ